MTTTSISVTHIPNQASTEPQDQTQVSINAERAFLRFDPRWSAFIHKVTLATRQWIREKFELPDSQLIPGKPSQHECPIAKALQTAGFLEVRVHRTRLTYRDPTTREITRVMFPGKVRSFVRLYDAGYITELRQD